MFLRIRVPISSYGIFAVGAEVTDDLPMGPVGWQLDRFDVGVGRHYSDHYQDPVLIRPGMTGPKFRTTLLKDAGE